MKYLEDGVDHINIFSKGQTPLGRFLSNFTHCPFQHPEFGAFNSIEGFWFWLGSRDDKLRQLHSFAAKKYGQSTNRIVNLEELEFRKAILESF